MSLTLLYFVSFFFLISSVTFDGSLQLLYIHILIPGFSELHREEIIEHATAENGSPVLK